MPKVNFEEYFISQLPSQNDIPYFNNEYWNVLEVHTSRILEKIELFEDVEVKLNSLGKQAPPILCRWLGLESLLQLSQSKALLAQHITSYQASSCCRTIVFLSEFLHRRRPDAIERIARLLLPSEQFGAIQGSKLDPNSKRFCYTLLIYVQKPGQLQLLALFESAERSGYSRYSLVIQAPDDISDEETRDLEHKIEQGIGTNGIDLSLVTEVLAEIDGASQQPSSRCSEVFFDSVNNFRLAFIWRHLRESHIREVDGVVFANEAELIVLRLINGLKTIEVNTERSTGVKIAHAIASKIYETVHLQYEPDSHFADKCNIDQLIHNTKRSEKLSLREVQLRSAPIEDAPQLMIRCQDNNNLSASLEYLRQKQIDLLDELANIRHVKIGFESQVSDDKVKTYAFKLFFAKKAENDKYLLTYSGANIPTHVCTEFENYVKGEYEIQVIPRTK